jgi:hypothetical protein
MSRKQSSRTAGKSKPEAKPVRCRNRVAFTRAIRWFAPLGKLFKKDQFHGNTKWIPEQLVAQALIWSWQVNIFVTDAFQNGQVVWDELSMNGVAKSYTSMMNALVRYADVFSRVLREHFQALAEEVGGRFFEVHGWTPIAFDGSRATAPRSAANERAFCAPEYGKGKRSKRGRRKSKGMRRRRNKQNPPRPQAPQAWITMLWHMSLRLPWTWRLGPSNSSERDHVKEILAEEEFPKNTLFCGDAGFTGYPLWSQIMTQGYHFLVRVGANVNLLSKCADIKKLKGGIVLCWPKNMMNSGQPPLRLRLVKVKVGKTKMWLLTSVLDPKKLSKKRMIQFYKMRWGIEVEFRGLKQTIDKHMLRCKNPERLLVELDWSLRAMAVAELLALREQIPATDAAEESESEESYDPKHRSLANTMKALRTCMRTLHQYVKPEDGFLYQLSRALVQRYDNRTDKKCRSPAKNPDKKPLGEPNVRKLNATEKKLAQKHDSTVA